MVKVGNINYFLGIILSLFLLILIYIFLKNKDEKYQIKTIKIILFLNLLLHFLKILFPPYVSSLPYTIRKITFENICAITTLLYPFVFLTKNKVINTYFFFISLVGGIVAVFYPMEVLDKPMWCFDTLRFYYCHITLMIVPILLGMLKIFTPDFKKAWVIPIGFIIISTLIFVNEVILIKLGLVSSSIDELFSRSVRNSSFVFGPLPAFDFLLPFFKALTPWFLRTNYWGLNVDMFFFPVLWLVIPSILILPVVYEIVILPFSFKNIKTYFKK